MTLSWPEFHWLVRSLAPGLSDPRAQPSGLRTLWLQRESELGCQVPFPQPPEDIGVPWWLLPGLRFLMRVLDSYGDDYRTSQFTIVLEVSVGSWGLGGLREPGVQDAAFTCVLSPCQDEGSQGTDAPTPGNAENEPPEKEGLSPPRRTPAPPEPSSPAPGEGPSGRKRRRAPREGRRGVTLTPELAPVQVGSWLCRGPGWESWRKEVTQEGLERVRVGQGRRSWKKPGRLGWKGRRKMRRGGYGERGRKGEVGEAGGNWRLHGPGNTGTLRGTPRRRSGLKSKNVGPEGLV